MSGTSVVAVLNRGFDPFFPTYPKYPLVIDFYIMIALQIVSYSAITFVRILHMDTFNLISNPFILCLVIRQIPMQPFIVRSPAYLPKLAKRSYRITMLFVFFLDCLIDSFISNQT